MANIPKTQREKVAEQLAFKFPTWFFELYTEMYNEDNREPVVLEDYQIKYLLDDSTFSITNKSRQAGGSLMLAMKKFHRAYSRTNYRCDIVSINLREATDKISYIRRLHDTLPLRLRIPLTVDNATSIGFHKGAKLSTITSIAASSGIRGGKKDLVFDEAAHITNFEELFYAGGPAIMNGGMVLDIVSTPRGNIDLFSRMWRNEAASDGSKPFSVFNKHEFIWVDVRRFVTDFEAAQHAWNVTYNKQMVHMPKLIEQYGNEKIKFFYHLFPYSQFQQEFCGVFLDEAAAFFPQSLIDGCLHPTPFKAKTSTGVTSEVEPLEPWFYRPENNDSQIFMGVDFGESDKDTDKTSIQVLERDARGRLMHRYSKVLKKEDYPDFPSQAAHIAEMATKFRVNQLSMDETGLGRGIVPLIRKLIPNTPIKGVTFNYVNKEEMVMNLKTLMEKKEIWLQQDDIELHGQIRGIERKITEAGRALYSGEPHDDMFWALCLAAQAGGYKPFSMFVLGG